MELKELRIGNKIICNGEEIEVCINDFAEWEDNESKYCLEPLELNEDRLLELGFFTRDNIVYHQQARHYSVNLFFYDCWNLTIESDNETCEIQGYYDVHNLQNIVFSITGVELPFININQQPPETAK
jgi:hypothetical protein